MRKIVASHFVSLDGVAESPGEWTGPFFTPEVGSEVGRRMEAADTMLLGRRTYDEWAGYWPTKTPEDDPFAGFINSVEKVVVSTTLAAAEWANTTIVRGTSELVALRERPGKDVMINGSLTLTGSLIREGGLDELQLLVFPVLRGSGRRLLDGLGEVPLTLLDSRTLEGGVLSLVYAPRRFPSS
jgi:dihydrofolate reductase